MVDDFKWSEASLCLYVRVQKMGVFRFTEVSVCL